MLETALLAFTTFIVNVGPLDTAALFPALTPQNTARERRAMAPKGCLDGGLVPLFFALFGERVLAPFGITLPALRTAGGVLVMLIALDMVFARSSDGTTTTADEWAEAAAKRDVSVFPLATPLIAGPGVIAGPGAIGASILLVAALAVQFVFDGLASSGLLSRPASDLTACAGATVA
ncbi:MAG: MarC family protein [Geminicoccaceae bacterium]